MLTLFRPAPAGSSPTPPASIGDGPARIVEYDLEFRPLRTFVGLHEPTDITPLADGSVLVADRGAGEVLSFDPVGGKVHWRRRFAAGVQRARPRARGGFVITSIDKVLLTNAALEVEREVPVKGVRVAVELPNGHLLTASNEGQGWLTERRPDGSIAWQSKSAAMRLDPSGKWVSEREDQVFSSTASLDVRSDGAIFVTDFDRHTLRLLSKDYRPLRIWGIPGYGHFYDTRFGPSGELVAVAPESQSVWVEWPDGETRAWTTPGPSLAVCANLSSRRTFLVGFRWRPEAERLNAAQRPVDRSAPFHETLPGAVLLGASGALLVGIVLRRSELENATRTHSARNRLEPAATPELTRDVSPGSDASEPARRLKGGARASGIAVGLAVFVVSTYAAWRTARGAHGGVAVGKMREFALACIGGGVALRLLNGLLGTSDTFSHFSPRLETDRRPPASRRVVALVVLALSSLTICLLAVVSRPKHSGLAVGAWTAAQILLLAAAYERPTKPAFSFRKVGLAAALLGLILLGAIVTRFWQLAHYPDFFHWDHGIYGRAALLVLRGEWSPFFVMDPNSPSISRPWVAVCAALLGLFGPHYWVLRLTGAISGVVLVLATYLLGSALFNRRVGVCAAFLAAVNHVLLLYSRQSYVLDPAPFFVLALYCAVVGLQRGSRFHWCLAGVLSGWTLLTYWASTALAVVGAAILGGFVLFYPRWLWRRRMGLLWMLLGVAIVYLPMLPHLASGKSLAARLHETTSVLQPDGSIQRDPAFWTGQLKQTFGMILRHGEVSPWGMSTGKPILIGVETVLFGIGLIYLILSRPPAPALLLLTWLGVGFFVGNGLFRDPTTLYHCLAAIPPILIVSGVAVDRFLALADRWKLGRLRVVPAAAVFLLLGFIGLLHLRTVWSFVGRPAARQRVGRTNLRADVRSIVPRFVRENPRYRYYIVRTSTELTSRAPSFIFFADDSDVSDVTGDLKEVLPVSPVAQTDGAAFVVLPGRSLDGPYIRAVYPNARTVELLSTDSTEPVRIYLVDASSLRRTFEAAPTPSEPARSGSPEPTGKPQQVRYGVVALPAASAGGYQKIGPGSPTG